VGLVLPLGNGGWQMPAPLLLSSQFYCCILRHSYPLGSGRICIGDGQAGPTLVKLHPVILIITISLRLALQTNLKISPAIVKPYLDQQVTSEALFTPDIPKYPVSPSTLHLCYTFFLWLPRRSIISDIIIGELGLAKAIGVHHEDFSIAVTVRNKDDLAPIRRPCGFLIV